MYATLRQKFRLLEHTNSTLDGPFVPPPDIGVATSSIGSMTLDSSRSAAEGGSARGSAAGTSAPNDQASKGVSLYTTEHLAVLGQAARILDNSTRATDKDLSTWINKAICLDLLPQQPIRLPLEGAANASERHRQSANSSIHTEVREFGTHADEPGECSNLDETIEQEFPCELSLNHNQMQLWPPFDGTLTSQFIETARAGAALDLSHASLSNLDNSCLTWPQHQPSFSEAEVSDPTIQLELTGNLLAFDSVSALYSELAESFAEPSQSVGPLLERPDQNYGIAFGEITTTSSSSNGPLARANPLIPGASPSYRAGSLDKGPISDTSTAVLVSSSGSTTRIIPESTSISSASGAIEPPSVPSVILPPCSNDLGNVSNARRRNQRARQRRSKRANEVAGDDDTRPRRRGPLQNKQARAAAALTRKLKACVRCRFNKITCTLDPHNTGGQCLPCKNLTRSTLAGLPCLRYIITDASLYREQNAPYGLFSQRWSAMDMIDVEQWASPEIKAIEITQDFCGTSYALRVRQFVPLEGDLLEEIWNDNGTKRTHQIPPYAIADMGAAAKTIQSFVDSSMYAYISETVKSDTLLWDTYLMAFKHMGTANTQEERDLLLNALRLWVVARISSNPERICGREQLGIPPVTDPSSPWANGVPIPPVMCAQLEVICYSQLLRPLSSRTLSQLQNLAIPARRRSWFTIYLTSFIHLHSIAILTRRDEEYARQLILSDQYCNPEAVSKIHVGALVLLAHFHFINKGKKPFELVLQPNGRQTVANLAELTPEQAAFIEATAIQVKAREAEFQQIRQLRWFGHNFYFLSQLFDETWRPTPTA